MIRWNGWGEEGIDYPLSQKSIGYLAEHLGQSPRMPATSLEATLSKVPSSKLPEHPGLETDPLDRLVHARGQSLPDWIAYGSGQIEVFPDGVAYPKSEREIRDIIRYAKRIGCRLIPYGGGTSVVGHINPMPGNRPSLTVDLSKMNQLLDFDEVSEIATFEAGVSGPVLESQLRALGYTLGHYPQSFEYSTLGGWIATRSSGQQSYYYGRIEDMFAGGRVETTAGTIDLPPFPASAAGPDLRHLILGSEGRIGLITQAMIRVRAVPAAEKFGAIFFRDWLSGVSALRSIAKAGIPISMLRLSDSRETETTLTLAGHDKLVGWLGKGLNLLRYGPERCLLIYGLTGSQGEIKVAGRRLKHIVRQHKGLSAGTFIGNQWRKGRFHTPYLRNTLWQLGYAIDTLETAVLWSVVPEMVEAIRSALLHGLEDHNESVLVLVHLSHVYKDGASIYVTFLYRRAEDPAETLLRWSLLKDAASCAIVEHGGTITHQHGVGLDHAKYLPAEKGKIGMQLLNELCQVLDPERIMNPGKLLEPHSKQEMS